MKEFFRVLRDLSSDYENMAMTVIEGEALGEKLILSRGNLVYESKEGLFSLREGLKLYSERIQGDKKLVICGGGHISIPLITMGRLLGFHVTVIEDRILYADNARRAKADRVICDSFQKALQEIDGDASSYFIIVTRGHRHDQDCLEEIVKKNNGYIGMIGSKLRVKKVKEELIARGIPEEALDKVYSPIGLKIGAETPEEIAVAIMAEVIQVSKALREAGGYSKELLSSILEEDGEDKILATIIKRKGSAPRGVGAKMLIFKDGRTLGTIGGGCVEADIITKARYQLLDGDKAPRIYKVDMTGADAEEEGMVCGGTVDILLEWV
ncbi:XdhC family protein [Alloiococcus sp. CFN-8]|uniref:XdhC family protein n=1 Tax=Alloiococcus sp. CFN-8 TaxID=3416081 RepID=UPI003CFAC164